VTRPPLSDADRLGIFRAFLAETPEGLLHDRPHAPDHFRNRLVFEAWRARWLPYLAGLAEGPTTAEEYAVLRPALYGLRRPDIDEIDRFHS
jgi:hypothetical protein